MGDSFSKKENAKKKAKKLQEKALRREQRKKDNNKGKTLDDMLVYVDEFGNLQDTPPEENIEKKEVKLEDIQLGAAPIEEEPQEKTGVVVKFFEDKGFGFITQDSNGESIFFHNSQTIDTINLRDKVIFEIEKTPRGYNAIQIKKVDA